MSDNPALANLKSQVSHKVCDLVLQHAQSLRTRSGWKRNRPPKAMGIARYLALAILSAELVGVDAFAGSGSTTLTAEETITIRTSVVYRDIKVCNDSASQGDLLAAFGSNEPVRLAPGMCQPVGSRRPHHPAQRFGRDHRIGLPGVDLLGAKRALS